MEFSKYTSFPKLNEHFRPDIDTVYFIKSHTLVSILSGSGGIQVDFKTYFNWQNKVFFLETGQHIKFLSDDFQIRKIEFSHAIEFQNPDSRVLFKHLISLGYITIDERKEILNAMSQTFNTSHDKELIQRLSKQWFLQNPFNANKEEYNVIFDAKMLIDNEFRNHISIKDLVEHMQQHNYNVQHLIKNKIGITLKKLLLSKQVLESQKQIAFTDKTIQEIAFDLGYKDSSYFNRKFKKALGLTPLDYRTQFQYKGRDTFTQDLLELLRKHHKKQHYIGFYADKMHLSPKTLSRKVQNKLQVSLGQLIRSELIQSAKQTLLQDSTIVEVSNALGFEEPQHFSRFFKHQTGLTPSQYKHKKYHN